MVENVNNKINKEELEMVHCDNSSKKIVDRCDFVISDGYFKYKDANTTDLTEEEMFSKILGVVVEGENVYSGSICTYNLDKEYVDTLNDRSYNALPYNLKYYISEVADYIEYVNIMEKDITVKSFRLLLPDNRIIAYKINRDVRVICDKFEALNNNKKAYANRINTLLGLSRLTVVDLYDDGKELIGGLTSTLNTFGRCLVADIYGTLYYGAFKEVDLGFDGESLNVPKRTVVVTDLVEVKKHSVKGLKNEYYKFYYDDIGCDVRIHTVMAIIMGMYDGVHDISKLEVNHQNLNTLDNSCWNLEVITGDENKQHGLCVRKIMRKLKIDRYSFMKITFRNKDISELLSYHSLNVDFDEVMDYIKNKVKYFETK